MLSLAQSLTLSDFHQMYAIERAYYDPRYITPPQEAFRWYQAYPLSTLAVKEGEMVAGFLNLFPVRQEVFAQILAGTFNDREMELCQLADPFSGTGTLHMFLCCIARRLDYQGQGVGGLLLKAGVEAYRTVAHRCGAIITDNVTEAGRRLS
ncbi:MAG: GNAT family N-acetyltransferase, partial [Christensenellales bacterium]|nr:GNAT family N-acetyltransferase [Christensenellales bacterium]